MDELDTLLAFYDFPKEHWVHLRTTVVVGPAGKQRSAEDVGTGAWPPGRRDGAPATLVPHW